MDIGKLGLFANLKSKMGWLAQRQGMLAHNIANSDTPDFRPMQMKEWDPSGNRRQRAFQLTMAVADARHQEGLRKAPVFREREQRRAYEAAPGGNAVILEEQLVALQENQIDYQTMTRLYQQHARMMKMSIGRGR